MNVFHNTRARRNGRAGCRIIRIIGAHPITHHPTDAWFHKATFHIAIAIRGNTILTQLFVHF